MSFIVHFLYLIKCWICTIVHGVSFIPYVKLIYGKTKIALITLEASLFFSFFFTGSISKEVEHQWGDLINTRWESIEPTRKSKYASKLSR